MDLVFTEEMCVMKRGNFTLFVFVVAMCAACSKDKEMIERNADVRVGIASVNEKSIVTNWESTSSWNVGDSSNYIVYMHDRSVPEITSNVAATGAVMVWVKNIRSDEGGMISKPQQLPLAVIKQFGKPAYDNFWYQVVKPGNVTVKFRTNKSQYTQDPVPIPDASTQLRYFIISKEDLDRWGHTPVSITRLTYEELINLIGITP